MDIKVVKCIKKTKKLINKSKNDKALIEIDKGLLIDARNHDLNFYKGLITWSKKKYLEAIEPLFISLEEYQFNLQNWNPSLTRLKNILSDLADCYINSNTDFAAALLCYKTIRKFRIDEELESKIYEIEMAEKGKIENSIVPKLREIITAKEMQLIPTEEKLKNLLLLNKKIYLSDLAEHLFPFSLTKYRTYFQAAEQMKIHIMQGYTPDARFLSYGRPISDALDFVGFFIDYLINNGKIQGKLLKQGRNLSVIIKKDSQYTFSEYENTIFILSEQEEKKMKMQKVNLPKKLKKLKQMLLVSKKISLNRIQSALSMDEGLFNEYIFDWASSFNYTIDGEYLIVNKETIDDFISLLDKDFENWNYHEKKN